MKKREKFIINDIKKDFKESKQDLNTLIKNLKNKKLNSYEENILSVIEIARDSLKRSNMLLELTDDKDQKKTLKKHIKTLTDFIYENINKLK